MTHARASSRSSSRYRGAARAPVRTQTTVTSRHAATTRAITSPPTSGDLRCAARRAGQRRVQPRAACRALRRSVPSSIAALDAARLSQSAASCPTAACWSSARPATGVQLADEIHRSGRPGDARGRRARAAAAALSRTRRAVVDGASGVWNQRYDEIDESAHERAVCPRRSSSATPSTDDTRSQRAHRARGVALVGRLCRRFATAKALFSGVAAQSVALADLEDGSPARHLRRVGAQRRRDVEVDAPERFRADARRRRRRLDLDLRSGEIRSIVWATGFRPDYQLAGRPGGRSRGHLRHDGGVVIGAPGLYALGLPVPDAAASPRFIHGWHDAREAIDHLASVFRRSGSCKQSALFLASTGKPAGFRR